MIHQLDFNGIDKVEKAIKRIQLYERKKDIISASAEGRTAA